MATFRSISVSLLAVVLAAAAAFGAEAFTVSGKSFSAALTNAQGEVKLTGGMELSSVARIVYRPHAREAPLVAGVRLGDGSAVRGAVSVTGDGQLAVSSARLGPLAVSPGACREVFFACRRKFPPGAGRGALLSNGDFVSATAVEFGADSVALASVLGEVRVPLDRVAAVRLSLGESKPAEASVILDNGDMLNGVLKSASGEAVTVASAFGDVSVPVDRIQEVVFSRRLAYLSDMPVSADNAPAALEAVEHVARDLGLDGRPLRSAGHAYRKGLAIRSGATVTVDVPANALRLHFVPGIAERSDPSRGTLTVTAGGKVVWRGEVPGREEPKAVALDLRGARSITFRFISLPADLPGASAVIGDAFATLKTARGE